MEEAQGRERERERERKSSEFASLSETTPIDPGFHSISISLSFYIFGSFIFQNLCRNCVPLTVSKLNNFWQTFLLKLGKHSLKFPSLEVPSHESYCSCAKIRFQVFDLSIRRRKGGSGPFFFLPSLDPASNRNTEGGGGRLD